MFLRRLDIENIRSIRKLSIDFDQPDGDRGRKWTLIVGENGAGKSTLLRAVARFFAPT